MPQVVTFTNYIPTPRYDGLPWARVRIDESISASGPWATIDTIDLVPLDADPAAPMARNFTTELATLDQGWYRVTFLDETGDTAQPTQAVHNIEVTPAAYWPTVDQVAAIIRTRTKDTNGNEIGTFNNSTRPTGDQVQLLMGFVSAELYLCVGDWLPVFLLPFAQSVIAIRTAMWVELTYFPEQINEDSSVYEALERLYTTMSSTLCEQSMNYRPEDITDASQQSPGFYFGDGFPTPFCGQFDIQSWINLYPPQVWSLT